ncbi:MAG: 50S ribosomal protein L10 [Candidatus Kerfeldbacteria bacterium]|nr:50S ribosomal protein L10 [Candidatus Kerfeldbacteria bacterium]
MAKTRLVKEASVRGLVDKLNRMKSLVFTSFAGLKVPDATELRKQLRQAGVDYTVAKKTLLKRALTEAQLDPAVADQLSGGSALAFGYDDEVLPARLLSLFAKDHPAVELTGGWVGGRWLAKTEVVALAQLPTRPELMTILVWMIRSPLAGLTNVFAGTLRSLLYTLNAIKEKQPAVSGS